jgi:DNA-directed RNA polymerase subunit M/transcription elongation factor TFIIS
MIISIMAKCEAFINIQPHVRDGIIIGCERGVYNRAIQILRAKNRIASWMLNEFVNTYMLERHMMCDKLESIHAQGRLPDIILKDSHVDEFDSPWSRLSSTPIYKLLPEVFDRTSRKVASRQAAEVMISYLKGFKCWSCSAETIKDMSVQMRSADESANHYYVCYSCGSRKKTNS